MSQQDPYKVLGVSDAAGLDEIRQAFRREALRCHPDLHPERRSQAEHEFRALLDAYQAVLQKLAAALPPKFSGNERMSPVDFALMDTSWLLGSAGGGGHVSEKPPHPGQQATKITTVTKDENRLFIWAWLATTVAAVAIAIWLGQTDYPRGVGVPTLLAASLVGYVLLMLLTVCAIILTRKVIYMIMPSYRKALPSPSTVTLPKPPAEFPRKP